MSHPNLSELATDLLAEEPLDEATASTDREERMARAIAERIRERRTRRRVATGVGALAVAAIALVGIGRAVTTRAAPRSTAAAAAEITPGSTVVRGGAEAPLASSAELHEGDRIRAAATGDAVVALTDGSRVRVGASGEVSIAELATTRRFVLSTGMLRADVHKLGAGERFVIATGDAEVEVHGTSFEVSLASEACRETRTRVHVYEGVVAVRSAGVETRLFAGEDWPRGCRSGAKRDADGGPTKATAAGATADPRPGGNPPTTGTGASAAPAPPMNANTAASPLPAPPTNASTGASATPAPPANAPPPKRGALAEQNDLFARATAARKRGDEAAAIATYEELIARHPGGSLTEAATVERMRALEKLDHARGAAAARAYLAAYPRGFARAEAERIAR